MNRQILARWNVKCNRSRLVLVNLNDRLVFWACIGAICSSILSIIVFAGGLFLPTSAPPQPPYYGKALRRPNPYVNLDKVLRNGNYTFPPIMNFPPMVLQINTSDPQRKMREDDRQWRSSYGTVYPDDRHIVISSETSTIVQFRNLDYAMERCILTALLPRHTEPFDPQVSLRDPSTVDVWELDTTTEIARYIPDTWHRAAKRRQLFTTLEFSHAGPSNSSEFHCPSNEFTTLEFACSPTKPDCSVDFWQDQRAVPRGGIYIVQYQSPIPPMEA
ncbi:uncharacterized protein LAESUDRAFT_724363 [Laetiporus sulphureus 93-53]|uniref:Ubiquitin 3 binding protein But2 C-terminal domain-containing protein n=1 Tax=Laetiporus sulphureus 93-53 TaxID=1314785 RepID=A0A165EW58_9APHY|nr:uncharacterized protein LAESUDRAFT_724363 [Laetiporus sulphureus 93-53]KZT07895.1 hypothetical protein LAESUDRAFT_724363 [Laetiporus sulphureus 93-53]